MLIIVFQEGVLEFAPYDWQTLPVGIRQWSNLYMPLPLSICTGFFQFSSLKYVLSLAFSPQFELSK